MFQQDEHFLTFCFISVKTCANCSISPSDRFSNCRTRRSAVRLPIPGKEDNWSTAFSIYLEGIFTP